MLKTTIIVPLSTRETLKNIADNVRVKGVNIWEVPVISYRRDRKLLDRTFDMLNRLERVISIFTSKTAVEVVGETLTEKPHLADRILKNVIAIGPYTALKVKEVAFTFSLNPDVKIPPRHTSKGLINLIKQSEKYVIWCSKHANEELKEHAKRLNCILAPIYTSILNIKNLKHLIREALKYKLRYYIFTSLMSVKAWKTMLKLRHDIIHGKNCAIVLSSRIASKLDYMGFEEIHVYNAPEMLGFINFIYKVIP